MPSRSAAMQPPYSIPSRTIRSGSQSPAISSRSGTMSPAAMSTSVVTVHAGKSGPGGGTGGKAAQVDWSDIAQSRPAARCVKPKASTWGRKDGAEQTATSCPAPDSARATGTRGWRWPSAGWTVSSARTAPGALVVQRRPQVARDRAPRERDERVVARLLGAVCAQQPAGPVLVVLEVEPHHRGHPRALHQGQVVELLQVGVLLRGRHLHGPEGRRPGGVAGLGDVQLHPLALLVERVV